MRAAEPGSIRNGIAMRNLSWAPTIALSCPWAIAFFYSFQVTLDNGWLGFVAFAIPIALNLLSFGWIIGKKDRDVAAIFKTVQSRYTGLFLSCQVFAVTVAVFVTVSYLFIPLFGPKSVPLAAIFILLATAAGHSATIRGLKLLHLGYLAVGLPAAILMLFGLARVVPAHPVLLARLDGRFFGMAAPVLMGFLLAPWTDVQHWQRAIAIQKEGLSIRRIYTYGALLVLALITLNAGLAILAGPNLVSRTSDGLVSLQSSVGGAIAKSGNGFLIVAFLVWAGVAVASTLDSFYYATRWLLRSATASSNSPLLAFVPIGIVTSPLWYLCIAIAIALVAIEAHVAMIYIIMPYASLIVGSAACLACETMSGRSRYDGTLCTMIGAASYLMLVTGYLGDIPPMIALAPLVGLIGAAPAIQALFRRPPARAEVLSSLEPVAAIAAPPIGNAAPIGDAALTSERETQMNGSVLGHGYDGQWYYMHLVPTYDDTNSVGNVYFANYFRWIGKTRELLFNASMPDFDLRDTSFYILTKSFEHDFRREIKEFTPVTVRIKMSTYNRKFVTLVHEIHSRTEGLIGKGAQTLMFVDTQHYKPIDIPPVVLRSFMPFFAQAVRLNAPRQPGSQDVAVG